MAAKPLSTASCKNAIIFQTVVARLFIILKYFKVRSLQLFNGARTLQNLLGDNCDN
jgi:hypothetical protein